MTANIRTALKQKITPLIKSFVASDMYEIDSTININGENVSRFRLFFRAIGVDDKTQDQTEGLYADTKRTIYGGMITDFIKANSEAKTKGTKTKPSTNKEDNIGRRKLIEVMKKYILKNPNDPRFIISEQPEPEVKGPEPEVVDGPQLAQADAKDQLQDAKLTPEQKAVKLNTAIEKYKDLVDKKKALDQFRSQSKLFGLAESKRLLSEKKAETKVQGRKRIADKLKQDIKRLKEESISEAKAIAQAKREEKARKTSEQKREYKLGLSDTLRAPIFRPQIEPIAPPQKAPEEKKQTVFDMGLNDLLASAPAPRVTSRVVPAFAVIPPLVSTPEPVQASQAEAVLEQPQEVKQRQRSNMAGLLKRQQERKEKRQVKESMNKMKSAQPRTREQFIAEQEQQFIEAGLNSDAEVQTQQQRERMLEQQLEEAQQEVKIPPARTRMSDYILQQLGGATFSALSSILARRAMRTGNSDLGGYSAAVGGILGSAVYNGAMRLYPDVLNDIMSEVNDYFGITPQDIIKEARSTPPQGPQGLVEDVKGEGKHDSAQPSSNIYRDTTPEQIDAFRASHGQPPVNRGVIAKLRGLGGAASAYFDDAMVRQYERVKRELDPQRYDEEGKGIRYNILGTPLRYDEEGNRINALTDRDEAILYDRPDQKGMGGMEVLDDDENEFLTHDPTGNDLVRPRYRTGSILGNRPLNEYEYGRSRPSGPSRIRELIERSKRVLKDNEKNIITGGSAIAGAGLVGAGIASSMNKQQPRIKENPLIFKQEQTTQGAGESDVERGAGKLKPKFIVPSANIFSKTEQEQYVDDMEFAMFDFVQDEGGNDPYGTNPILRDQHMTENLRYQRSGVNVYSLYGANLPDNPRNMPAKKMQEMFLGENRLPEMKFLFSNEFEAQEFNQSEFEVDEYDVNNERTAIEAFSPYANFTNNQLLDQFYDTSILYGVVP
jgi:hypothetical protein